MKMRNFEERSAMVADFQSSGQSQEAYAKTQGVKVSSLRRWLGEARKAQRDTASGSGFVIWHKRLELGRYKVPTIAEGQSSVQLDSGQLSMLLDGVDLSRVKRQKRWAPKKTQLDRILY